MISGTKLFKYRDLFMYFIHSFFVVRLSLMLYLKPFSAFILNHMTKTKQNIQSGSMLHSFSFGISDIILCYSTECIHCRMGGGNNEIDLVQISWKYTLSPIQECFNYSIQFNSIILVRHVMANCCIHLCLAWTGYFRNYTQKGTIWHLAVHITTQL